jgi:hypothetical protein
MNLHQQIDDEISLIDILLFLKASVLNVVTSTIVFLLFGAAYFFSKPEIYEATAVVQMAVVVGEAVETPVVFSEKIKLPLFFSLTALQACGLNGDLSSHAKFADKIKTTLNKSAPFISLTVQGRSPQEARFCMNAVISDIRKYQDEQVKPIVVQKKQIISQLNDQLKFSEDLSKKIQTFNNSYKNQKNEQNYAQTSLGTYPTDFIANNDLKRKIMALENELIAPQTQPLISPVPMFVPEVSISKRPMLTLGFSLALGVFLGLLITAVQLSAPKILRQIQEAEAKRV